MSPLVHWRDNLRDFDISNTHSKLKRLSYEAPSRVTVLYCPVWEATNPLPLESWVLYTFHVNLEYSLIFMWILSTVLFSCESWVLSNFSLESEILYYYIYISHKTMLQLLYNDRMVFLYDSIKEYRGGSTFLGKAESTFLKKGLFVFSQSVELDILHKIPVQGHTNKWTHVFIIWIKRTEHINPHAHCWNLPLFLWQSNEWNCCCTC
jgi:hypothetical protein